MLYAIVSLTVVGLTLGPVSTISDRPSPSGQEALVRDSFCYATTPEGITILNVSLPESARFEATLATPGIPRHLDLADSLLYVADDYAGLTVINVADPRAPKQVGSCGGIACAFGVGHFGSYVYVSALDEGLVVVDASDPAQPVRVGAIQLGSELMGLTVRYPYMYVSECDVANRDGSVLIFDITTSSNPTLLSTVAFDHFLGWDVVLRDTILYACSYIDGSNDSNLALINVADPVHPRVVGRFRPPDGAAVYGMALRDNDSLVFLAAFTKNLVVVDVADPTRPRLVANLRVEGGQTEGLGLAGDYALLLQAVPEIGLVSVDVSDPSTPVRASNLSGGSGFGDLFTIDDRAYLCRGSGVDVYELDDPREPSRMGCCPIPAPSRTVAADSQCLFSYGYVGGRGCLGIYDIRDLGNPILLGTSDTFMSWANIVLRQNHVYYIGELRNLGSPFFVVVDVSNPAAPTVAGKRLYRGTGPYELAFDESRPYVYATEYMLMRVYDVSNSLDPVEVAQCTLRGSGAAITVAGQYAYVADYTEGLTVVDISDPVHPAIAGSYSDLNLRSAIGVAPIRNAIVVANGLRGLWLLDASNLQAISFVDTFETPYSAHFLRRLNDTLLLQSDGCRVTIWSVSGTGVGERDVGGLGRAKRLSIAPTCGRGDFLVSARSEGAAAPVVEIHSADGRLMGKLSGGRLAQGRWDWHWHPRSGPLGLPAGVYYLVMSGSSNQVARAVLAR